MGILRGAITLYGISNDISSHGRCRAWRRIRQSSLVRLKLFWLIFKGASSSQLRLPLRTLCSWCAASSEPGCLAVLTHTTRLMDNHTTLRQIRTSRGLNLLTNSTCVELNASNSTRRVQRVLQPTERVLRGHKTCSVGYSTRPVFHALSPTR